jgi:hypothetical protein
MNVFRLHCRPATDAGKDLVAAVQAVEHGRYHARCVPDSGALLPGGPLSVIISLRGVAQATVDVLHGNPPAFGGGWVMLPLPLVHDN